jgi:hypothetical protein
MKYTTPDSAARRRLIRGALAAPALATIHPGSAWAQGSLLCIQRPAYTTFPVPIEATAGEQAPRYIRVLLSDLTTEGSQESRQFVDGSNVVAAANLWGFVLAANYVGPRTGGEFQEFDRLQNKLIGEVSTTQPGSESGAPAPSVSGGVASVFGGLVHGRRTGAQATAAPAAVSTYTAQGKWAAVMSFNEEGEAVGVGLVDTAFYAVTESCWSSLRPGMAG